MPAWFAGVPYQGTRPRALANLSRSDQATQPPATGPPRAIAAMIGAIDTDDKCPARHSHGQSAERTAS